MTFKELLIQTGLQEQMPEVFHPKNGTGRVTCIKHDGKFHGCAVQFYSLPYESFVHESTATDERRLYLRDLTVKHK